MYHLLNFVRIRTEGWKRGMSVGRMSEVEARKGGRKDGPTPEGERTIYSGSAASGSPSAPVGNVSMQTL